MVGGHKRWLGRLQVQRDYEELPAEQVPALRGKLLALTLQNARASPALRTQLCLAMAALAVHLPASQWTVSAAATAAVPLRNPFPTCTADLRAVICETVMLAYLGIPRAVSDWKSLGSAFGWCNPRE